MKNRFKIPSWVTPNNFSYNHWTEVPDHQLAKIRLGLSRFHNKQPLVSIVIPVWNEQANILRTLSSFSEMEIPFPTELIFVNNNSTDETQYLLDLMEVQSIFEPRQGIAHARLAGLQAAKGVYHLCGDGDSIYPPTWINEMVSPLMNDTMITCVYGNYSFIPWGETKRATLGLYEIMAEALFEFRRIKREFLNVRGANFGFRTAQGRAAKGFEMTQTRVFDNDEKSGDYVVFGEDGRMGRKLGEFGRLKLIRNPRARIWTSSRRLLKDGSLWRAFQKRIGRELIRLNDYAFGSRKVKHTTDTLYGN